MRGSSSGRPWSIATTCRCCRSLLGRRRGWMPLTQIGVALGLTAVGTERPGLEPRADGRGRPHRGVFVRDPGRRDRRLAHQRRRDLAAGDDGGGLPARLSAGADLRRRGRALHRRICELARRLFRDGVPDGRRHGRNPVGPLSGGDGPAQEPVLRLGRGRTAPGSLRAQGPAPDPDPSRSSACSACRISSPA